MWFDERRAHLALTKGMYSPPKRGLIDQVSGKDCAMLFPKAVSGVIHRHSTVNEQPIQFSSDFLPMAARPPFRETTRMRFAIQTLSLAAAVTAPLLLNGCATESSQALVVPQVTTAHSSYTGARSPISIGKFDNRSSYMRGVFSDGADRLGSQAKTILITHLQQTNRFNVLDRDNLQELKQEAGLKGATQKLKGADFVVTGDVTEFGRKEVGDHQLFGLLGRSKTQVAYAKVSLNIVNIVTSEVVYSVQGAGEYSLSNREIIGFGGTASYDSTLNGKVLDLAIRESVNKLTDAIDSGAWKPAQ
jgi:curli biogenesis system outer membrane secretion channel CsgG